MGNDDDALNAQRAAVRRLLTAEQFVDVCATIAAFNVVDRIADATGIPLDDMMKMVGGDIPQNLNLTRFRSAANTLGASTAQRES